MNIFIVFVLLLVNMPLSRCCTGDGQFLFCPSIPTAFPSGYSTLLMSLRDVGQINSTMLSSDNLSSVSRLRMEGAGVTAVADGAFSSLQNLQNLSLNRNLLTGFGSDWFARPNALVELDLAENQIEVVTPSMLSGFSSLRKLNLSRNRIEQIRMGSFSSLDVLSELDLSGNRMTRVSPRVFSSLTSTRIRLDGNPWNCSCEAEQFVDFLKDLVNQSRLHKEEEVTCGSPASLSGLTVWNVSVCVTSTPSTSATEPATTSRRKSVATTVLHISAVFLTSSASSQTESSVSAGPSDHPTHTLTTHTGNIETCATSQLVLVSTDTIFTVVAVLVFLCFLLLACVLWLLFWRKRNRKTVTPGTPADSERESTAGGSASSPAQQSDEEKEPWDTEVGWRSLAGVRTVKSAHAALCTSPCGAAAVRESATVQTETQPRASEEQGKWEEGGAIQDGVEIEMENETHVPDEATPDSEDLRQGSGSAGIANDALPYLSIGANLGGAADEQPAGARGQRATTVKKVMRRISTWPPAAVEWQARRKRAQEEEGRDALDVWPPEVTALVGKAQSSGRRPEKVEGGGSIAQRADGGKISDAELDVTPSHVSRPPGESAPVRAAVKLQEEEEVEEETHRDLASGAGQETPNSTARGFARAAKPEKKAARGNEATAAAERRGVTPNDETLLSGNEYVFVDLLHEVAQNKGRWTRERWRKTHARTHASPGGSQRGADAHLK